MEDKSRNKQWMTNRCLSNYVQLKTKLEKIKLTKIHSRNPPFFLSKSADFFWRKNFSLIFICLIIKFKLTSLSYRVIVVPPFGFLRIFITSFHVKRIVRWPFLFFAATKHAHNTKANWLHRECGRPIISQNRQTNMSIAVNVRMNWNILTNKNYLWWVKRIFGAKFEL